MQLSLFDESSPTPPGLKTTRSGTFVDNMTLPVHRWFRYSAGFSAEWVKQLLEKWGINNQQIVLDPFAGSGTVPLVCDTLGIKSIGIDAHPVVARISRAKLQWLTSIDCFLCFSDKVKRTTRNYKDQDRIYPELIHRSFDPELLATLNSFKLAWLECNDQSPESELVWLAITAILRPCSKAGTAQWQYILPNKTKSKVLHPDVAFTQQIAVMADDMRWMQLRAGHSYARIINGDARKCAYLIGAQSPLDASVTLNGQLPEARLDNESETVDAVITSPPYANNYDYADALRFEMTFWGDVGSWGDIHDKVRRHLIVSSSQHSSKEKLQLDELLATSTLEPIRSELGAITHKLADVREDHGGKKHYHTMVAAYCRDISLVLLSLRESCKPGAHMCWMIGDSAPYGIYCPIERWIGQLALGVGFSAFSFEKLRDRNIKWKNRKHRVPLQEGLLWIEG